MTTPAEEQEEKAEPIFTRTVRISAFWPCFWLGMMLLALKILFVPLLDDVPKTLLGWGRDIAILSASDVVFAIATGLVAQCLIFFTKNKTKLQRGIWITYIEFGTFS